MIAAAAMAAAFAVNADTDSGLVSSTVVGYQNKTATEGGLHFVTSTFLDLNGSKAINDLFQLDATVGTGTADLQLLDKDGIATAQYKWLKKGSPEAVGVTFKDGQNGVWAVQTYVYDEEEEDEIATYTPISDSIETGRAIALQFQYAAGKTLTFKGAVSDVDVNITNQVAGLFFVGNPFPQMIDLQALQMDETVGTGTADLQLLDKDGIATAQYKWLKKGSPEAAGVTFAEGQNGLWAVQTYVYDEEEEDEIATYTPVAAGAVSLDPGDGVQIQCGANKGVKIFAPFSL